MIKAVIWDMDGVLIESEHIHAFVESETLKQVGINIPPEEITKNFSGVKIEDEFNEIINTYKKSSLEELLKIREKMLDKYFIHSVKGTLFVKQVLEELAKHYLQGLATSTERKFAEAVLTENNLLSFFNARAFGDMVQHSKPNPDIFNLAAQLLKIKPEEAVVIEDSASGFKAAKSAGMKLIARKANHNATIDFSVADLVIEDLRQIPNSIESINR